LGSEDNNVDMEYDGSEELQGGSVQCHNW